MMNQKLLDNNKDWNFEQDETIAEYPQYEELVPQQDGQMKMVDWTLQNMNNNFTLMGQYDGPLNAQGLAEGQGTVIYANGNRYVGQFLNGMKHGTGTMHYYEGSKFEGNYENDFRQGQGKFFLYDGTIIETNWVNDMMNGEGLYTNKKGEQKKCIFFNNTKIDLDKGNQDETFQDCAMCNIAICIAFYGIIIIALATGQYPMIGLAMTLWTVNCIMSFCCSSTCKYLFNMKQLSNLRDYLQKLKQEHPQIKFHIQCYHYETVRNRDKDGKTTTSRRKVVTCSKTKWFRYDIWCDRSQDIYSLDYLQTIPYARLHIDKSFDYSERAANSLMCQRSILKRRYRYRDSHMSFSQSEFINGFSEYILIFNDFSNKKEHKPKIFSKSWYITATLFCVNFINKMKFIEATRRVDWQLNKYIIS